MGLSEEIKKEVLSKKSNYDDPGFSRNMRKTLAQKYEIDKNYLNKREQKQKMGLDNNKEISHEFHFSNLGKQFTLKGDKKNLVSNKNKVPGPGAYPQYGDFTKHPGIKPKGWIFEKAEKKVSKIVKNPHELNMSDQTDNDQNNISKSILPHQMPIPGPGAYEIFNSGLGTGFGPPLKSYLQEQFNFHAHSSDNVLNRK
jgi:hypothetical protein